MEVSQFLLAETEKSRLQLVEVGEGRGPSVLTSAREQRSQADGREDGADVAGRLAKLATAAGTASSPGRAIRPHNSKRGSKEGSIKGPFRPNSPSWVTVHGGLRVQL